jgi:hypothetical protein
MKWTRWVAGALAVLGLALVTAPTDRAQAFPVGPGSASAVKDAGSEAAVQVRWGGHFHGGFGHFHGGWRHGGGWRPHHVFFRPRFFHRPRYYAYYNPYPYYAPVYRCPVVWTYYGPRRICGYRRYGRWWGYHRPFYRYHYVHRYRYHRWM